LGARVAYIDAHVPRFTVSPELELNSLESLDKPPCDCALVVTAHKGFPYGELGLHCSTIVDTRRAVPAGPHLGMCRLFQA
jgi:hypothetical protein